MKFLHCIAFCIMLVVVYGCQTDVELNPQYNGGVYDVKTFEVFDGTLNGIVTPFWTDSYSCNSADGFVYDTAGAAYMNDDGSQVACTPYIYNRTYADESTSTVQVIR